MPTGQASKAGPPLRPAQRRPSTARSTRRRWEERGSGRGRGGWLATQCALGYFLASALYLAKALPGQSGGSPLGFTAKSKTCGPPPT